MAQNGYKNNPGGAFDPGDDQELGFIPASPPPPAPAQEKKGKDKMASPRKDDTLNFLKSHWGKALMGLFIGTSVMQSQIENPQHSTFSWDGGVNAAKRVSHNVGWWVGGAWDTATGTAKPVLKTAGLVNSGTQPATFFIICKDKELDKQLAARDPRARAFMKDVQPQLELEATRLAFQDAAFYKRHSDYDVGYGSPLAVFHIEGVPNGWSPNVPYLLKGPTPLGRSNAHIPGSGCGINENQYISPIPGVDSTPGYKAPKP